MKLEADEIFKDREYHIEYHDCDDFSKLPDLLIGQVWGVCFYNNKLVIGKEKNRWVFPGGRPEEGETMLETLHREVQEESNMKILLAKPVGYRIVIPRDTAMNPFLQLRYSCLVEPLGDFISDPDNGVSEIKLIDPKEYKQYFDWGRIGDRIVERALEIKNKHFMNYITYDEFKKMDIRVGTVLAVEPVPDTDKLLKCTLDFGEMNEAGELVPRTIVSGIREYYPEYEQLVGKQLLYIVNLEPRMIKGIESQGMLLAVGEGAPTMLVPETPVPGGSRIR